MFKKNMDQSAYVAGFFGVLIGITLTELMKGIADTIKNSKRVKYYIPHGILVTATFVFIVQSFFDFQWFSREISQWTPLLLIRFSLPWVLLCLTSYLLFPSFEGNDTIDFKGHFDNFSSGVIKFSFVLSPLIVAFYIFRLNYSIFHIENLVVIAGLGFSLLAFFLDKNWIRVLFISLVTCYLVYKVVFYVPQIG
jgi:hypothetical protein